MADKTDRDRKTDDSIREDLDFGSLDNITLDFPGAGDEGVEGGKGRKPTNPKKQFAIEAAKGIGGGVLSASKTQLRRAMPAVGTVVDEAGAAIDDFRALKEDIGRQLSPITTSIENASRKLLPKIEGYLPKKIYKKISGKLEERAAARSGGVYQSASKEQQESDQIRAELASVFGAQMETSMAEMREQKKDAMVDRALGSMRHKQQTAQLVHVYDAVRATELFHKTQHVAYMKKSLELKYKHIFIARDTFNLLQQSMKTFEGYYKGILANTALPDMMKAKATDYIKKSRTQKYGETMANALGGIRSKIFGKIKDKVGEMMGQAGMFSSMLETMASMSDMGDMGGEKKSGAGVAGGLLGKALGYFGGGALTKKLFGGGPGQEGMLSPYLGALNTSVKGMRANFGVKIGEWQQKMAGSTNPILAALADFLPNTLSQSETASNDMMSKAQEAAPFDVITRQSIVEVIPGYLGKIWHEIAMMRTGDESIEERTFNIYQRKFTGVSELKTDISDAAFGTAEDRGKAFTDTIAKMQAGAGRNASTKMMSKSYKQKYKEFAKDLNHIFLNHAMKGAAFHPEILREFVVTRDADGKHTCSDMNYVAKVTDGIEHDPVEVLELLADAMFTREGTPDRNAINTIGAAITENYRKQDKYKERLATISETYGLGQYLASDLSNKDLKELEALALKGGAEGAAASRKLREQGGIINRSGFSAKMNLRGIAGARADLDYGKEGNIEDETNVGAQYTRKSTYESFQKHDEAIAKMLRAGNIAALEKYFGKDSKSQRFLKRFKSFFSDDFDPESIKMPGEEKELASSIKSGDYREAAAKLGLILRGKGHSYETIFQDQADKGKPEEKMGLGDAWTDLYKRGKEAITGKKTAPGEEPSMMEDIKAGISAGVDRAKGAVNSGLSTIKSEIEKRGGLANTASELLSSATERVKTGWTDVKKKAEASESLKKFKEVASATQKKCAELKKEFDKTPAGKKTAEILATVEQMCSEAVAGGEEKLEALRQSGALDNPSAFIRYCKEQAGEAIDDLTEDLPPLKDTEAWKALAKSKAETAAAAVKSGLDTVKNSDMGKKATSFFGRVREGAAKVVNDLKSKFGEGAAEAAGQAAKEPEPTASAASPTGAGTTLHATMQEPEEREPVEASSTQLERIIEEMQGWRKESTDNQGTVFDAVAQIDETLKNMKGGLSVGGGNLNEEELAKQLGKDIRKHSLVRRGLHAAKEGIAGTVKGVGKVYTKIYSSALGAAGQAAKGLGFAAGRAIDNIGKGAKAVGKWLTHKEDYVDVYVKGKEGGMPLVSARKQRDPDEGIFYKSSGKRVKKSADIDEPCVDKNGNIVISDEDIKRGLVMHNSSPIGKIGAGMLALGKGYFSLYGKAIDNIGSFAKTTMKVLFGSAAERYVDVYRKDEVGKGPLITAKKQEEEGVYFFESGKKVKRSSDIHEPICDRDKKMLITKADVEHGLVDVNNKPLGTGGHGGVVGAVAALAIPAIKGVGKLAGKLLSKGADIYGTTYKKAIELGAGALKGTGKFIGRALGLDVGGMGGGMDPEVKSAIMGQWDLMKKMQADIALMADQYRTKNPLDKDGDGDIDGSYADQMEKKKGDAERIKAEDVHKDVKWGEDADEKSGGGGGKDKDEGGGIFDMLGKLVPKKYRRRIGALKRLYTSKALKFAKGAGNWLMKGGKSLIGGAGRMLSAAMPALKGALGGVGKGLGTAAKFVGGKAAPLLGKAGGLAAKALPFAAKAGGMAMHGLGAAGSAIGGLASSAGTALSGLLGGGGLAGLGSTLAAVAGPAALAALAGYGIYRGVKGFSKKNALENVGKSEGISKENQLTGEDRMYSALGMNSKIGAKTMKFASQALGIHGLIKGIRGNDNPLTDKEIEKGRARLQNKMKKKGGRGYDRILQEYEKAVEAGNWNRARQLSGQEADGLIKSMWKNSIGGMVVNKVGSWIFGDKDKEMTEEEIKKTRDRFQSLMKHGGNKAKNAEKLLSKFDDYVAEQDWKNARKIAGMEQRGLFGKFFQDSKGNVKWGKLAATAAFGLVGLGASTLLDPSKDPNKPMTEKEIKDAQAWFQKQIDAGSKPAQKLLDQFNEAVTEQNWKKARKLCGKEVKSNLSKTLSALGTGAKIGLRTSAALMTGGMSEVLLGFMGDQDTPMKDEEIKKFRDKMNYMISKGDKLAERKLEKFEEYVGRQQWEKARKIAKMPHKGWAMRATKAVSSFFFGDDEKEMTEQEIQKFRDSMNRKMDIGGKVGKMAQRKLEAFDDAVGRQNWKKARILAQNPNDGLVQSAGKAVGKAAMGIGRFFFGGDGKPMSESEIEQARKKLNWAISENRPKAQKRLEMFEDFVADEKWEKARKLVKMPYENIAKRVGKAVGGFLFGNDRDALTPEEIQKFQDECDQRIADGETKYTKILAAFNSAVEVENWAKARKISKIKAEGVVQKVGKALNPLNWFKDSYEDCQKIKEEIEEKAMDDETGIVQQGLEEFEKLVRRRKYKEAMKLGKDLKKMKPAELSKKHGFKSEKLEEYAKRASDMGLELDKRIAAEKSFFSMKRFRLKSLKSNLMGDPSEWSDEFFDDIEDRMNEICGTGDYAEPEPDDKSVYQGNQLINDIDKTAEKFSWWTSPLIKSKLGSLKSKVKSSMTEWDEDTIAEWRSELKEIAGKDAEDSSGKAQPDEAVMKDGNTLLKDIEKTKNDLGFLNILGKSRLNSLKSEIETDVTAWTPENIKAWRERLKEIGGEKAADSREGLVSQTAEESGKKLLADIEKTKEKMGFFSTLSRVKLNGLKNLIESDPNSWNEDNIRAWRKKLNDIAGDKAEDSRTDAEKDSDSEANAAGEKLLKDIEDTRSKYSVLKSGGMGALLGGGVGGIVGMALAGRKKMQLSNLASEISENPAAWSDPNKLAEWRKRLRAIAGDKAVDSRSEEEKDPETKIYDNGKRLLSDVDESLKKFPWKLFGSNAERNKLNSLKNEIASQPDRWGDKDQMDEWENQLRSIDKDYKSRDEKRADAERLNAIEDTAFEKAGGSKYTDFYTANDNVQKLTQSAPMKAENVKYYGKDVVLAKPWLGNVEHPGNPEEEAAAEKEWREKQGQAQSAMDDVYKWMGKSDDEGNPLKATRLANMEYRAKSKVSGLFTPQFKIEHKVLKDEHNEFLGNQMQGFQWDKKNPDTIIKWENGKSSEIALEDLSDTDLLEIAHQRGRKEGSFGNVIQDKAIKILKDRGVPEEWWNPDKEPDPELKIDEPLKPLEAPAAPVDNVSANAPLGSISAPIKTDDQWVLDPEAVAKFENKFANGGFVKRMGFGGFLKRMGKRHPLYRLYSKLRGKFVGRSTSDVDAAGNPIQYGEAGPEAIMPIESKPGNLVSILGKKIAGIMGGVGPGPAGDGDATSALAGTTGAEPMENKLAGSLTGAIGDGLKEAGTSALGNLASTGITAAATAMGGPVGGMLASGLMKSGILQKGAGALMSGASDLLSKGTSATGDLLSKGVSGASDLLAKAAPPLNPLDKLKEFMGSKSEEGGDNKSSIFDSLFKSSSGNGDKLGELVESNKKLAETLIKVLTQQGVKIQGMDDLMQATAVSGQSGGGESTPVIIQQPEEKQGFDFSKTGSRERQKFNG